MFLLYLLPASLFSGCKTLLSCHTLCLFDLLLCLHFFLTNGLHVIAWLSLAVTPLPPNPSSLSRSLSLHLSQEGTIRWRSGICSMGGTMWSGSWGGAISPPYGCAGTYSESHTHMCAHTHIYSTAGRAHALMLQYSKPSPPTCHDPGRVVKVLTVIHLALIETHTQHQTHHTCTCWRHLAHHHDNGCNPHHRVLAPAPSICTMMLFLCWRGNQGGWMTVSSIQCHLSLTHTHTVTYKLNYTNGGRKLVSWCWITLQLVPGLDQRWPLVIFTMSILIQYWYLTSSLIQPNIHDSLRNSFFLSFIQSLLLPFHLDYLRCYSCLLCLQHLFCINCQGIVIHV